VYGEHIRERVAAPGARTHGFVGRQIEAHAEGGRGETAVEQRACGNAERQVDRLAQKSGQGTLAGGSGGICTVAILQRLGKRAERPLLIVVFVAAADIVKRLKITHASTISHAPAHNARWASRPRLHDAAIGQRPWACNYRLAFRRGSMLASLLSQLGTGPAESPLGFQQADRG